MAEMVQIELNWRNLENQSVQFGIKGRNLVETFGLTINDPDMEDTSHKWSEYVVFSRLGIEDLTQLMVFRPGEMHFQPIPKWANFIFIKYSQPVSPSILLRILGFNGKVFKIGKRIKDPRIGAMMMNVEELEMNGVETVEDRANVKLERRIAMLVILSYLHNEAFHMIVGHRVGVDMIQNFKLIAKTISLSVHDDGRFLMTTYGRRVESEPEENDRVDSDDDNEDDPDLTG